jgi:hypothetical protein
MIKPAKADSTLRIRCSSSEPGLMVKNCRANPFNACQLRMYTRSIGCVRAILLTLNRWRANAGNDDRPDGNYRLDP